MLYSKKDYSTGSDANQHELHLLQSGFTYIS